MNIKTFIQRHPVATYFIMAFIISWLGTFLMVAPEIVRGEAIPHLAGLLMFPVLLIGPSLTGLTLTGIADGRSGLRDLFSRMGRWHVDVRWYAALLIPPVLILAVLLTLRSLVSPVFTPHLFPLGILFGLVPGFFEEIGWMGYAFPKMRLTRSALSASLLLGVLWGLWHTPVVDYLGAASPHGMSWLPFFLAFVAAVMAMRVLIVWIYSHTSSVLLAQLMHASFTGSLVMFGPSSISPGQEALWYAVYAATLWIAAVLVITRYGKHLARPQHIQPLQPAAE